MRVVLKNKDLIKMLQSYDGDVEVEFDVDGINADQDSASISELCEFEGVLYITLQ